MKLIQVIACILSVSLVFSADITFTATTVQSGTAGTATTVAAYGTLLKLTAAGWIASDPFGGTAATSYTVFTTLIASGGVTGVGIAQISGTSTVASATACTSTALVALGNSLTGKSASTTCVADFATLYTSAPSSPASTTAITGVTVANKQAVLVVNQQVQWSITVPSKTTPAAGDCLGLVIYNAGVSATPNTAVTGAGTGTGCGAGSEVKFNIGNVPATPVTYVFYVQADTSASVCFQTLAQYQAYPGQCSSTQLSSSSSKSASNLSVVVAPLLLLSAILLN